MVDQEETKLASSDPMEGEMPEITCVGCNRGHFLRYHGYEWAGDRVNHGIIRGLLICHAPVKREGRFEKEQPCKTSSVFEITGDSVSFLPGKLFQEDLDRRTPDEAQACFQEGLLAFYGQAHRATVAMCRSAVEASLDSKRVSGRDLYEKIPNAQRMGIIGDEEVSQAQAARLTGRDALHHGRLVSQSQALLALTATLQFLNHVAQQPQPASQSGTGSNAT